MHLFHTVSLCNNTYMVVLPGSGDTKLFSSRNSPDHIKYRCGIGIKHKWHINCTVRMTIENTYTDYKDRTTVTMEDSLYMSTSNTADIMRWWIKHNVQPHQEFTTFINTKPSDIVAQILQIRRETVTPYAIGNRDREDTNKKFFVQRLGMGRRVHTSQEEEA